MKMCTQRPFHVSVYLWALALIANIYTLTHTHTHIHNVHAHKQYSTHMWAQTYMLMHVLILKARHLHVDGVS